MTTKDGKTIPSKDADTTQETQLPVIAPETYVREGEVGRGGLGRIVAAKDTRLGRTVAIKELLLTEEATLKRFVREAKITAKLQHPSIVPVYEAGRWPGGEPFFAMKLVNGRSFDQVMADKKNFAQRLSLLPSMIDICEAMAYAHFQRIIHRDLKPANILVGDFGEIVIIDWGIAKELSEDGSPQEPDLKEEDFISSRVNIRADNIKGDNLTLTGSVVGTPAYMPPEQAQGKQVDERADVYALGVILYELLSGVQPHQGRTSQEVLIKLTQGPPEPLQKREPKTPRDLLAIVEKAMARNAQERYPSAKELANDLKKYQTGQLVDVYQYTLRERLWRWMSRNKLTLAVAAILLTLLFVVSGYLLKGLIEKEREAQSARILAEDKNKELLSSQQKILDEQVKTEKALEKVKANNNRMILAEAQRALEPDPTLALAWLKDFAPDGRYFDMARLVSLSAINRGYASRSFVGPKGPFLQTAISREQKFFASIDEQKKLSLWDVSSEKAIELPEEILIASSIAFSSDELTLWISTPKGKLFSFDLDTSAASSFTEQTGFKSFLLSPSILLDLHPKLGARLWSLTSRSAKTIFEDKKIAYTAAALSPDGSKVALARADKMVSLFDTQSLALITQQIGSEAKSTLLQFSPDGETLASVEENTLYLRPLDTLLPAIVLKEGVTDVDSLTFSPDGKHLAVLNKDKSVYLWDISGEVPTVFGSYQDASHIQFSSDSKRFAIAGRDGVVWVRDLVTYRDFSLTGHIEPVSEVSFSSSGDDLCSLDEAGELRCWKLAQLQNHSIYLYPSAIKKFDATKSGDKLAIGYEDGAIKILFTKTGKIQSIDLIKTPIAEIKFSPDGKWMAAASQADGAVLLWDLSINTGLLVGVPGAPRENFYASLDFSADNEWLAFVDVANDLRFLTLRQGNLSNVQTFAQGNTLFLRFSPTQPFLTFASTNGGIFSMDLRNAKTSKLSKEALPYPVMRYSSKGDLLVTPNAVWDMTGKKGMLSLEGFGDVQFAQFSPDEKILVTSGKSKTIQLWNVVDRTLIAELEGHTDLVTGVGFSADGGFLISTSKDKSVRLWDVETRHVVPLGRFGSALNSLVTLEDSQAFLSSGEDGVVRYWGIEPASKGNFTDWLSTLTTLMPTE